MNKTCKKCSEEKPTSAFYNNVNACKSCTKAAAIKHREDNINTIAPKDRMKAIARARAKRVITPAYRQNNRAKVAARDALNAALERGDIFREPCEVCGKDTYIRAYHPKLRGSSGRTNYSKPLNVRWLCKNHKDRWPV